MKSERLSFGVKCNTATIQQVIEVVTVSEAARKIGACSQTLRRQIDRNNVVPDAVLIEGTNRLRSPLFVAARLPELARLVNPQNKTS